MHPKKSRLSMSREFLRIFLLLAAFISVGETQPRPATLTPSVSRGGPGTSFRIDINPVIGLDAERAAETRMVLRPSQAQGPQTDVVLRIVEYHGDWMQVQIPRAADLNLGPGRLLWLNRRGDVLASSGDRLFRVTSAAPQAAQNPAPVPGADPRAKQESIRAKEKMTTPGVRAEAQEAQVMTTPGVSAKARRLPIPVADYVGIGVREIQLNTDRPFVSSFMLPADVRLDGHAVLTFMANPTGNDLPSLFVSINGHEIKSLHFNEGAIRACQIRFDARTILAAGHNELVFRIRQMSFEMIKVDEIVLWFHRDIDR